MTKLRTGKRHSRPPLTLKEWRAREALSTYGAAEKLNVSQSFYSKLENNTCGAGGKNAKHIAAITGVPVAVLVGAV